jgi:hypothetical protein
MKERKFRKVTYLIPEDVIEQVKTAAKRHYRSFNGEVIFGLEMYLAYFQREANTPKQAP